ncbi:MAG: HD domain-containing protein [Salinivirgaceae bacterium]
MQLFDSNIPINKKKIVNDPVYGFINFPANKVFDIVEHPWFQRLRRIKQLGLTDMVYPGARHTRFHHALGATHLMASALEVLQFKGHTISTEEAEAAILAILLHDIGHGPFSHALEHQIVNIKHEQLSLLFMEVLNYEMGGGLELAIEIFTNRYHKKFLHQLVSSQLDVDRLDYLMRDSFFTGVSEGIVSSDRIIKMLDVVNDQLVVEQKGIYSIEKFLIARRLMYWQVYLHKTVHAAEQLVLSILKRAKFLANQGHDLFGTPAFRYFLYNNCGIDEFLSILPKFDGKTTLELFALLDDDDLVSAIKVWAGHPDKVLSMLCSNFVNRRLFRNIVQNKPFKPELIEEVVEKVAAYYSLTKDEASYFVISDTIENNAYRQESDQILIKEKDGKVTEIVNVADMLNIKALSGTVSKYFLCYPKEIKV